MSLNAVVFFTRINVPSSFEELGSGRAAAVVRGIFSNQMRLVGGSYFRAPLGISRSALPRRAAHRTSTASVRQRELFGARTTLIVIEGPFDENVSKFFSGGICRGKALKT
jgi:hypothetical protein